MSRGRTLLRYHGIMGQVLGRVVAEPAAERGPDAAFAIAVPMSWLQEGCLIEVALPRNLTCAQCQGGGCDTCGRSGAISIRRRNTEEEPLRITLPAQVEADTTSQFLLRIPERGGPAAPDTSFPKGLLLLSITAAEVASPQVQRVDEPPDSEPAGTQPCAAHTGFRLQWLLAAGFAGAALLLAWLASR
jgi:hypothetical protein